MFSLSPILSSTIFNSEILKIPAVIDLTNQIAADEAAKTVAVPSILNLSSSLLKQNALVQSIIDAHLFTPTNKVSISGIAEANKTLTASNALTDANGRTVSYQWLRNGEIISGATQPDYTPTEADVGLNLNVLTIFTDKFGQSESFTNPIGVLCSSSGDAIVDIPDDASGGDALYDLFISEPSIAEGNSGNSVAVFSLSLPESEDTRILNITTLDGTATANQDYIPITQTVTFEPYETEKQVEVNVIGDKQLEKDETFSLIVNGQTIDAFGNTFDSAEMQATAMIINDDKPSLTVQNVSIKEGNSGKTNAVVTIKLSDASSETITVKLKTADDTATTKGNDYSALSGLLTFKPNETQKIINIPIIGDKTVEKDETFKILLSDATNADIATASSIVTILNDDKLASLSVANVSIKEGNSGKSNVAVTVKLSEVSTKTITVKLKTVDDTATTKDNDYSSVSGLLTFKPNELQKVINIPIFGDKTAEKNETFKILLSDATNADLVNTSAVVTITNDDAIGLVGVAS